MSSNNDTTGTPSTNTNNENSNYDDKMLLTLDKIGDNAPTTLINFANAATDLRVKLKALLRTKKQGSQEVFDLLGEHFVPFCLHTITDLLNESSTKQVVNRTLLMELDKRGEQIDTLIASQKELNNAIIDSREQIIRHCDMLDKKQTAYWDNKSRDIITASARAVTDSVTAALDSRLEKLASSLTQFPQLTNSDTGNNNNSNNPTTEALTYAQKASHSTATSNTGQSLNMEKPINYKILCYPKAKMSFAEAQNELKAFLKVQLPQLKVHSAHKINKGLAAVFKSGADRNTVYDLISKNEDLLKKYNFKMTKLREPEFILKNVSGCPKNKKDVTNLLTEHNPCLTSDMFQVRSIIPTNNGKNHIVISCNPTDFDFLNSIKHLYVGWERVSLSPHTNIMQCKRCLGFGHTARRCAFSEYRCHTCGDCRPHNDNKCNLWCLHCDEANHKFGLNYPTDHSALWQGCPLLERQYTIATQYIDYGPAS